MQAYDFLVLYQKYGCLLECGGDDQWSNILAGADLIRRKEQKDAYAMTFALLTTSEGKKMGKTQKGAVWIDEKKTSPYEFFQYWRNVDDADVEKCMNLLTFMPIDEIKSLTSVKDERINVAKERLAYEVTAIVHGKEKADEVIAQVRAAFSGDVANMPEVVVSSSVERVIDLLVEVKFAPSKGEARRLIEGGGVKIDENKVSDVNCLITSEQKASGFVLHKGKKNHAKIKFN